MPNIGRKAENQAELFSSHLGQDKPGREVASLASAFLSIGASNVVATLWRVDDQASQAFFGLFYGHLLEGHEPGKALRMTRLDCLKNPELKAPSVWAAYTLIGGVH